MHELQRAINRLKNSILNIEIKHTWYTISKCNKQIKQLKQRITATVGPEVASMYLDSQETSFRNRYNCRTKIVKKKLDQLCVRISEGTTNKPSLNEKAILNATTKQIPQEMLTLFSMGPKFTLPFTNVGQLPVYHLLASVENLIKMNPNKTIQDQTRYHIVHQVQTFLNNPRAINPTDPTAKFCTSAVKIARKFVADNPDLCIIESDKGNRTVIMTIEDYDQKMKAMVDDDTIYVKLNRDPTSGYETKNNQIVKRLQNLSLIDDRTAYKLKCNTAVCPRIYGQPKAHKPGLPLRPVVPNINSPTYQLSKFISNILQNALPSSYNIRDSFTFAAEINQMKIPANHVMVSFDVKSLFTNIPKELIIQGVFSNWDKIKKHTQINLDLFQEIVAFCLNTSYFMFRGQVYHQQFGTAMGSPLSPILADMVLDKLIATVTPKLDYVIFFLKKYVDDFFIVLPMDKVDYTLEVFNGYNSHLQFTVEKEHQSKLPFLDVVVIRGIDQRLSTEWYSKPIASGRQLNFFSYHPLPQKINTISNFIKRVIILSPNTNTHNLREIIHTNLRNNDYPTSLINRLFHRILPQATNTASSSNTISSTAADNMSASDADPATIPTADPTANITASTTPNTTANVPTTLASISDTNTRTTEEPEHIDLPQERENSTPSMPQYISFPYIPHLSQKISRILQDEYPTVKIAHRKVNTVGRLHTKVKDPLDPMQQHNVVYQIPCNDCDYSYIGMTTNKLKKRLSGHQSNVNQLNRLRDLGYTKNDQAMIQHSQKTALTEHCVKEDHTFALQGTKIIDRTHNRATLPLLECFHIYNTPHTVNHRTDVEGLSAIYSGLLRTIAPRHLQQTQTNPSPAEPASLPHHETTDNQNK